jgi:voltage-gated potassium channel
MNPFRNLRRVLVALAVLLFAGTVGFHVIEGWSWFDSFYMVEITLTSIGYNEVHPLSHAGRMFNVAFIATGMVVVALAIGALTQALLEFELAKYFGRRRMEREIERLSGHYIICGAGRVGRSAARELADRPAPFVIVESNADRLPKLPTAWLTMVGDASQEATLRRVRIEHARGLVAATTTDATNIYITLTARSLNPKLRIIARASEEDAEKHLRTAGADQVISPYIFAGHRIAQAFLRPNVVDFLDLAMVDQSVDLQIEEIRVEPTSHLANVSIGESRIHQDLGVIILAIKREGAAMRFNPTAADRIQGGDYLIAIGDAKRLNQLEMAAAAAARS